MEQFVLDHKVYAIFRSDRKKMGCRYRPLFAASGEFTEEHGRDFFPVNVHVQGSEPRSNWIISYTCLVDDDDWLWKEQTETSR
jgi:hypothetical protein